MRLMIPNQLQVLVLAGTIISICAGCRSYSVASVDEQWVEMTSVWDTNPDSVTSALLQHYKVEIDSMMSSIIGYSLYPMEAQRPESRLTNFAADVLMDASVRYMGKPADVALTNVGCLRSNMLQGDITVGNVYEIFPFESSLCILTLTGSQMRTLFEQIAANSGECISGARLVISSDGKLLSAEVGGKPLEDKRLYVVATIDYLAEGNDGMKVLAEGQEQICPEEVTLRQLVFDYIAHLTKTGQQIDAKIEGRILVQ